MSAFTDAFEQRFVQLVQQLNKKDKQKIKSYDEVCPEPKDSLVAKFLKTKESSSKTISCAAYIYCDGHILAGKRGMTAPTAPGKYNVPVGLINPNESFEDAIIREVAEETEIILDKSQLQFLNIQEWDNGKYSGANFKVILDGTPLDHPSGPGDGECDQYEWIPVENIKDYDWAFNMDKLILNYI